MPTEPEMASILFRSFAALTLADILSDLIFVVFVRFPFGWLQWVLLSIIALPFVIYMLSSPITHGVSSRCYLRILFCFVFPAVELLMGTTVDQFTGHYIQALAESSLMLLVQSIAVAASNQMSSWAFIVSMSTASLSITLKFLVLPKFVRSADLGTTNARRLVLICMYVMAMMGGCMFVIMLGSLLGITLARGGWDEGVAVKVPLIIAILVAILSRVTKFGVVIVAFLQEAQQFEAQNVVTAFQIDDIEAGTAKLERGKAFKVDADAKTINYPPKAAASKQGRCCCRLDASAGASLRKASMLPTWVLVYMIFSLLFFDTPLLVCVLDADETRSWYLSFNQLARYARGSPRHC